LSINRALFSLLDAELHESLGGLVQMSLWGLKRPVAANLPTAIVSRPSLRARIEHNRGMNEHPAPASVLTCINCGAKNRIRPSAKGVPTCGRCGQALPWLVDASDATFETEADASVPVMVDLWAPWCGPCRFVSPILAELSRDYRGRLKVVKVNVDDNPSTAQRYQAFSIPTMVVLRGGQPVDRIVGALPKEQLVARIAPHLA
jgi:thioredoxin 2